MSTSLLYHAFGVRGYEYRNTMYVDGAVAFTIEQERSTYRCSQCGSAQVQKRGEEMRVFSNVPIGGKLSYLRFAVPRVYCHGCGALRQVKIGFAEPRRRFTRSFERYALDLCRSMTILDVSRHLGVSWDVIKDIQKRHLKRRFARRKLRNLTHIAIDEISIGHGQKYLTVVLDLVSGAVVFIGNGKGADALIPFWKSLRAAHAKIEAVATDLSAAYLLAVRQNIPKAIHVFDRFHVVKLFNEKLSDFRRQLHHELTDKLAMKALKGVRWLLLMNPENLDDRRNERQRLEAALALNKPLATVYYMKESLRQFWEQHDKRSADIFLEHWLRQAEDSGISMLQKFANTLSLHRKGLLAYFDCPITTGPLEGINNKIKTMTRQAYGYRDKEFFQLKIYQLHETKYALVG